VGSRGRYKGAHVGFEFGGRPQEGRKWKKNKCVAWIDAPRRVKMMKKVPMKNPEEAKQLLCWRFKMKSNGDRKHTAKRGAMLRCFLTVFYDPAVRAIGDGCMTR
jgi:hypothetical protein